MQEIFSGKTLKPLGREGGCGKRSWSWARRAPRWSQPQKILWAGKQFNAGCPSLSGTAGQSSPHAHHKINSLSEGWQNAPFKLQLILFLSGP